MTITKIDDHIELAQDRLVEQYKNSKRLNDLIAALVEPLQHAEDEVFKVYTERWLDKAKGQQLDNIGAIVGEARSGRNDDDYKVAIILRIVINSSGGEPESIITAVKLLVNADKVVYKDIYPANFSLFIQGGQLLSNLEEVVDSLSPAGVGKPILTYSPTDKPFIFTEITNKNEDFFVQTSTGTGRELSGFDVNTVEGIFGLTVTTENIDDDTFGEGFAEVYINISTLDIGGFEYDIGDGTILQLDTATENEDYTISEFGGTLTEVI